MAKVDNIGDYLFPLACTPIDGGGDVSFWEAMYSAQEEEWVSTMKEEMDALVVNDTWELVDCPKNVKDINNHWVLQMKLTDYGLAKQLRARLVTKGHLQKAGIDYDETFSRVAG